MSDNDETNLATSFAGEIAEGGLQNAATSLLGYGLSSLGLGFPDATSSALSALQSELNLIESQLVALKSEMDVVKTRIDQSEYDERYTSLIPITDAVSDLTSQLVIVVSQKAASPNTDYSATKDVIMLGIATKLLDSQSVISETVLGPDGGKSMYELCSLVMKDSHRFLSSADTNAVQTQINYYQSHQFMQLLLLVQYYHAFGNSDPEADSAISTYQANIGKENIFQVNKIFDDVVVDQQSGLMIYIADNPYTDYNSVQGILAGLDTNYAGDNVNWRLPTVAELLSNDNTVGVFAGYASQNGAVTPPQWLMNNGVPKDMTGIHFWTSSDVPPPDRGQYGRDVIGYDRALRAWEDNGGEHQHYYVDSLNLGYAPIPDTAQAHVVAVRNILSWQKEPLTIGTN